MKYSYFEAKKKEMKFIDIFSRNENHIFEVEFENLNERFKGNETLEKTITNKQILIESINLAKENLLKRCNISENEEIVFCYRYFNFFPTYYNRNVKKLVIMPIIKFKENYYQIFNEFEYKKEYKDNFEYYDFNELQDIIQKYKYKKFDVEKIASEIVFDLIDDSNMALWNYEIENIDKGMDFEFYE